MQLTELLNLVSLVVIGGGFLSFLATQLVKQDTWPSGLKLVLSFVMAALFGLACAWVNGDVWNVIHAWGNLTAKEVLVFGSIVWASSVGWYMVAFKGATWSESLGSWPAKKV